jgi:hypothetical protein
VIDGKTETDVRILVLSVAEGITGNGSWSLADPECAALAA